MQEFDKKHCPVCRYDKLGVVEQNAKDQSYFIECPRCGAFTISVDLVESSEQKEKLKRLAARISGYIRARTEDGYRDTVLTTKNIDEISNSPSIPHDKDIKTKSEKLLRAIIQKTKYFGEVVELNVFTDYSLAFAQAEEELISILTLLEERGKIECYSNRLTHEGDIPLKLTSTGFQDETTPEISPGLSPSASFLHKQMQSLIDFFKLHDLVIFGKLHRIEKLIANSEAGDFNTNLLLEIRSIIVLLHDRHKDDLDVKKNMRETKHEPGEINVAYAYLFVNGASTSQLNVIEPLYKLTSKGKNSEIIISENDVLTALSGMMSLLGLLKELIERKNASTYSCTDCGAILGVDESPCPNCSSSRKTVNVTLVDTFSATSKVQ